MLILQEAILEKILRIFKEVKNWWVFYECFCSEIVPLELDCTHKFVDEDLVLEEILPLYWEQRHCIVLQALLVREIVVAEVEGVVQNFVKNLQSELVELDIEVVVLRLHHLDTLLQTMEGVQEHQVKPIGLEVVVKPPELEVAKGLRIILQALQQVGIEVHAQRLVYKVMPEEGIRNIGHKLLLLRDVEPHKLDQLRKEVAN